MPSFTLDLESDSLLALDTAVARNLARSIVTELLALSPFVDTLRVIAIGDLVDGGVETLEHITLVRSWDDISDDVVERACQSHDELIDNDWPNAFAARAHEP